MLTIDRLSVSFGRYDGLIRRSRVACLSDVSLSVARGEVLAIVGASGAGKSLVAHAIIGILPPNAETGGAMTFAGETLTAARQAALRGCRIALVPQSVACLDPMVRSGRQIGWAARRAGVRPTQTADAAFRAGGRFGLDRLALGAFPHELSGGMARRVMLAIATIAGAELIIADEPTNGLDPENAGIVFRHFRKLAGEGTSVILITHDLPAALSVADSVAVMRGGATEGTLPAAAFRGDGERLASPYARALWRALPQNGFAIPAPLPAD
jgi:peptide/nickel transport system ATP-binding protein